MEDLINQPDAHRLIFGLRDTGYNFNTAAADIIDNSIAASASNVNVRIELASDGRKFVYFGDDGEGMSESALFAAMRYGAPVRANLASLGKFGLGLKTASSSVCLKFAVITRRATEVEFHKLAWDLDHVEAENQ
jgi:DNA topoisomerase VI subunit B